MQRLHPLATKAHETPVGNYLIDNFLHGDVDECIIVTRPEKHDLLNYYSSETIGDMLLKRITVGQTPGTPWTIAHALRSALESEHDSSLTTHPQQAFALGFPDIITAPETVFQQLFQQLEKARCDVVLGLFRVDNPQKYDMVRFDRHRVMDIDIKPDVSELEWTWVCAVWNVAFSCYLLDFTTEHINQPADSDTTPDEMYVGDIFLSAMKDGLHIQCLCQENGTVLDIGTPEDLQLARSKEIETLFS